MNLSLKKADLIRVISSGLCLLDCLATPLLFALQTQIINYESDKPSWWSGLDIIFIIISALTIYKTKYTKTRKWIKSALWGNWILLLCIIINEKLGFYGLPESAIYLPSLGLIFVHIYNSKYCQCASETCCVEEVINNGNN